MNTWDLKSVRKLRGWSQKELARILGVSQPLVSLVERGQRAWTEEHLLRMQAVGVEFDPTQLPMRDDFRSLKLDYAQELANLGYPGFSHFRMGTPTLNPAQLLVRALTEPNLERRVAEGLPWLTCRYSGMNWGWVRDEAKLRDLQNRLGFTLALAGAVASQEQQTTLAHRLGDEEARLRGSLLAKQDTYCHESMTRAERTWLETKRSASAAAWHVLSDMKPSDLTHV
jgi:transcriptional regulator with XRE-family HTH domain